MAYPTKAAARTALYADGYRPGFAPAGRPLPWIKLDRTGIPDRRAVAGNDADGWRVVAYPTLDWLD